MYTTAFPTCVTPPICPCKTYKGSILLSAYTAVVWLYEPTASIPFCGEKEIEDIIPVMKTSAQKPSTYSKVCVTSQVIPKEVQQPLAKSELR